MRRTFKTSDQIKIPNIEVGKFMVEYAIKKGVPVYDLVVNEKNWETRIKKYPYFSFSPQIVGADGNYLTKNNITLEEFFLFCDNWNTFKDITVSLNSIYDAIITDKEVKVGCQNFSFEKILELAEIINSRKNS